MDNTTYPNAKEIVTYHFWFTAVLIVLSIIYSVPAVFNKYLGNEPDDVESKDMIVRYINEYPNNPI